MGADKTFTLSETDTYTLTLADFGFTDVNDNPPNAFQRVKIVAVPTMGVLRNDGVVVRAGDFITVGDINANKLVIVSEGRQEVTIDQLGNRTVVLLDARGRPSCS